MLAWHARWNMFMQYMTCKITHFTYIWETQKYVESNWTKHSSQISSEWMEPVGNIPTAPVSIWSQLNPIPCFFLPSKYTHWLDAILTSWMRSRWEVFKMYRLYFRLIKSAIHLHSKSRRLPLLLSGAIWENQGLSQMFIQQCNAFVWVCSLTLQSANKEMKTKIQVFIHLKHDRTSWEDYIFHSWWFSPYYFAHIYARLT